MKQMIAYFNQWLLLGTQPSDDVVKRSRIVLFNLDLLIALPLNTVSVLSIWFLNVPEKLKPAVLLVEAMLLTALWLSSQRKHTNAIVLSNLVFCSVVLYGKWVLGPDSNFNFCLLALALSPIFFLYEKKWLGYVLAFIWAILFAMQWWNLLPYYGGGFYSEEYIQYSRWVVWFLLVPYIMLRSYLMLSITDHFLLRYNDQREYLRKIIDLNPNFIFAKNRKGEFTLVNKAVANAYGTTTENLVGKTDADFNPNIGEVEHFRKHDLAVMDAKTPKYIPVEVITDAAGSQRFLQTVKTPIESSDGTVNEVLGVSTDITQRIADEAELQRVRDSLHQKNEQLQQYIESNLQLENFAYVASHDLREPLRSMIGYAQLLQRKFNDKLDDEGREYIAHIISSTKNMNKLIADLLTFSRVNTEKFIRDTVHMQDVILAVNQNVKAYADMHQAVVHWHAMPVTVRGDSTRLIQLFQNLVTNAIKFHRDDVDPEVNIRYRQENHQHIFEVSDNGIGIEERFHEKIFLLFNRVNNRSLYEGSGIGLATCKKIVEQHGGTILLHSVVNQGTTFTVSFPVVG